VVAVYYGIWNDVLYAYGSCKFFIVDLGA